MDDNGKDAEVLEYEDVLEWVVLPPPPYPFEVE